uniref:Uncharacterized protein n=1 Tax=Haplochromis burtoni TaxID=8153 RepID=A0A3Q2X8P9_HAPBU
TSSNNRKELQFGAHHGGITLSVYIAGRHEHPEVGEERGPEWQKTCQNGDNKQGHLNCVTIKTTKGLTEHFHKVSGSFQSFPSGNNEKERKKP